MLGAAAAWEEELAMMILKGEIGQKNVPFWIPQLGFLLILNLKREELKWVSLESRELGFLVLSCRVVVEERRASMAACLLAC